MDKIPTIKTESEELLKKMISTFELSVDEDTENQLYFLTIKTDEEASTVIGRHGETIRAIQKILEVILFRKLGEPVHILVNVNDYREKQKERLEQIASELADKTKALSRSSHFKGLSSYERRIVHEYITKTYPDLTTYSIGEGRDRHLVIDLKQQESEKEE